MESQQAKTERRRKQAWPRPDASSVQAVRRRLRDAGQTVVAWAAANGETPEQVHKVLSGKRPCITGEALRIAIKLGLREDASARAARG